MDHLTHSKLEIVRVPNPGKGEVIEHADADMSTYSTEVSHVEVG